MTTVINCDSCTVEFYKKDGNRLVLVLSGDWSLGNNIPFHAATPDHIKPYGPVDRISFNTEKIVKWDSQLLLFLAAVRKTGEAQNIAIDYDGLPRGAIRLFELSTIRPQDKADPPAGQTSSFLYDIGHKTLGLLHQFKHVLDYIGDIFVALVSVLSGRPCFRKSDFLLLIQDSGYRPLSIIALIGFLMGMTLAFMGAVQLQTFGAQAYIAGLVGIATARVNGAVMTGVIMAGRTGAAYAAQIGTMQVNEELDALATMGISPMAYLVIPRILALGLMMPLLCLYADLIGILGGMVVGVTLFDIHIIEYYKMTVETVTVADVSVGIFQSLVFGLLVAACGCYQGLKCGRSASAVGDATTRAVVSGIVSIVVATAVITILCYILGV